MTNCKKCHDSGLIPFEKDGKVIPHAWIDCPHCYQRPVEHYHPMNPADYDYACSNTFRAHSFEYCNQSDPAYITPEPEAPPQEIFHYHVDLSKQILRNLEGQVNYLQGKLTEKQERKQPKTSGYKGIK